MNTYFEEVEQDCLKVFKGKKYDNEWMKLIECSLWYSKYKVQDYMTWVNSQSIYF